MKNKTKLSLSLAILLIIALIPFNVFAEESEVIKSAADVARIIRNAGEGEKITISVDEDMDFTKEEIDMWGAEITINNVSNKDIVFTNLDIYGEGSLYLSKGINIYGDNTVDTDSSLGEMALFADGDAPGTLDITINGDIVGTKGGSKAVYLRSFTNLTVNGDVYSVGGSSCLLLQGGKATINGDVIVKESDSSAVAIGTTYYNNTECLVINGNVKGGDGKYGGHGIWIYDDCAAIVTINGDVSGGDSTESEPQTGEFNGFNSRGSGYALYATEGNEIRYSGKINGGKLGDTGYQKGCYTGGDISESNEIIAGKYTYIGEEIEQPEETPDVSDEKPNQDKENISVESVGNKDIVLSGSSEYISQDSKLVVDTISNGEIYSSIKNKIETEVANDAKFVVYNIDLVDKNNDNVHELGGYVTVSMPIPEALANYNSLVVYRYETDGTLTKLNTRVNGDKIQFETNHFSTYVIVDIKDSVNNEEKIENKIENNNEQSQKPEISKGESNTSNKLPQTGMMGTNMILILGLLVTGLGIYFINRKKIFN